MFTLLKKFAKEEEGNIIEYIIVLAVVAVIVIALIPGLRGKITGWFSEMIGNVDTGIGDSDSGTEQCTNQGGTWVTTTGTNGYCTMENTQN